MYNIKKVTPQQLANLLRCPVVKETRSSCGEKYVSWWVTEGSPKLYRDDFGEMKAHLGSTEFGMLSSRVIEDTSNEPCGIWYPVRRKK